MSARLEGAAWTSPESIEAVRPQVKSLLMAVPAFGALSAEEQRALAANMVKVLSYISDPNGVTKTVAAQPIARTPVSRAQDAVEATKESLSQSPGTVGKDFRAGAVREGAEQFGALVKKVDFPKFVAG